MTGADAAAVAVAAGVGRGGDVAADADKTGEAAAWTAGCANKSPVKGEGGVRDLVLRGVWRWLMRPF